MPFSNIWSIRYAGVTKTAAAWGIKNITRSRKADHSSERMTLSVDANVDSDPLFPEGSMLALYRAGVPVFYGRVDEIPRDGSARDETMQYTVADPWWWLENVKFQQQWVSTDVTGAIATLTTTRSRVIVGQALTGISLNVGQVMREVLYYALYSAQGLAFPNTVDGAGLPAAPSMTAGPFRIGTLTPTIVEPFFEATDKYCSEIFQMLFRYLPDVIKWFDYSALAFDPASGALTVPPTLNIDSRANLAAKTIPVLSPLPSGARVTNKFSPRALKKLQVPVVILKYEQVDSIDGETYDVLTIDPYPPGVADNAAQAFVQTIDLSPGSATYQHQDVTVQNLPVSAAGSATLPWVKAHIDWLFGTTSAPSIYDTANISVLNYYGKDLDPQDPYVADPPSGFALNNLVAELIGGAVTRWMTDDQQIFAANVILSFQLGYSGSDAATAALFQTDPANPNTRVFYIKVKATNAQTQTYKQMTSYTPPEPVPVGNAQKLYQQLSVLHYQGTINLQEPECSDLLPIGTVFNTTDGRAEWQAMSALVIAIEEDIGAGSTKVEFGPRAFLGAQDLVELDRANRGRIVSWRLNQRTNGVAGADNAVIGHTHTPVLSTSTAPGGGGLSSPNYPFAILTRITPGTSGAGTTYQRKVILDSTLCKTPNLFDNLAITELDVWRNLNGNDTIWMLGNVASLAVTPGTVTIHSYGKGDSDYNGSAAPWSAGGIVENDGASPPNQTLFRKVIATFVADGTGKPTLQQQWVSTTQLMKNTSIGGYPATYPGSFS